MKCSPYESPFVRESRRNAIERAKAAKRREERVSSNPQYWNTDSSPLSSSPPIKKKRQQPWNSDFTKKAGNNGLFDPSLKKVEIFRLRPGSRGRRNVQNGNRQKLNVDENRGNVENRNKALCRNPTAISRQIKADVQATMQDKAVESSKEISNLSEDVHDASILPSDQKIEHEQCIIQKKSRSNSSSEITKHVTRATSPISEMLLQTFSDEISKNKCGNLDRENVTENTTIANKDKSTCTSSLILDPVKNSSLYSPVENLHERSQQLPANIPKNFQKRDNPIVELKPHKGHIINLNEPTQLQEDAPQKRSERANEWDNCCKPGSKSHKHLVAQKIIQKIRVIHEKGKDIEVLLNPAPLVDEKPVTLVSIPHICQIEESKILNQLQVTGVAAPAVRDTYEVGLNDLDRASFYFDKSENLPLDHSSFSSEEYELYEDLKLLQYTPEARINMSNYRHGIKRMCQVRNSIFRNDNRNFTSASEVADRLTEAVLDGVLNDVNIELEGLLTDIASKIVHKI